MLDKQISGGNRKILNHQRSGNLERSSKLSNGGKEQESLFKSERDVFMERMIRRAGSFWSNTQCVAHVASSLCSLPVRAQRPCGAGGVCHRMLQGFA